MCTHGSQEMSTRVEVELQEVVGQSQGNWCPSMLVARKWVGNILCLLSICHSGAVGASRWVEAQREKGAV